MNRSGPRRSARHSGSVAVTVCLCLEELKSSTHRPWRGHGVPASASVRPEGACGRCLRSGRIVEPFSGNRSRCRLHQVDLPAPLLMTIVSFVIRLLSVSSPRCGHVSRRGQCGKGERRVGRHRFDRTVRPSACPRLRLQRVAVAVMLVVRLQVAGPAIIPRLLAPPARRPSTRGSGSPRCRSGSRAVLRPRGWR